MIESYERLKTWLKRPDPTPLPKPDTRLALGALLVRIAKADNAYLFEELEQIDRVLARLNGVNALQAAKMRAMCEKLEEAVPSTPTFAKLLRENVDYAHRLAMVTAIWEVVLADGIEQNAEIVLVDLIERQLGIDPTDSQAAHDAAAAKR